MKIGGGGSVAMNPKQDTEKVLIQLGVNPSWLGYLGLALAADLVRNDCTLRVDVWNNLYWQISERLNISANALDLAIRRVIGALWAQKHDFVVNELFYGECTEKPSPAKFIGALAAYLGETD